MSRTQIYVHALSPMHIGTGHSVDVIDLPVARERATDLPYAPGSALKGVLRSEAESRGVPNGLVASAFGPEDNPTEGAGAVTFGDGRLLLFPVRAVQGLFAWVTSPYLLRRYFRDRVDLGRPDTASDVLAEISRQRKTVVSSADMLRGGMLFLEDADLDAAQLEPVSKLAETLAARILDDHTRAMLPQRLAVVDDSQLGVFVRQCTEVTARVKLKNNEKTVERGGLWYEEALPAETVLYANVFAERSRHGNDVQRARFSAEEHLTHLSGITSAQIGGKASVGRGLCRIRWEA